MNKTLAFVKNALIATGVSVAAGIGASELAGQFSDNGKIIGVTSTAAQYVASFLTFTTLHGIDNKDIYKKNNRFDYSACIKDNLKFMASFVLLDIAYILGRPFAQNYFLNQGMGLSKSSLAADSVFITAYSLAAYPLARLTGILRSKKRKLEKQLE